ncbi:MAG TPA: hypothetical protein DD670_07785 [Planctomycetaceae bacterium]|nr:hypothetical protein [Planctomycetaceae bacterium]
MTDFEQRLNKAIQRGERLGSVRAEAEAEKKLNEEELRRLHRDYRLELTEHIEKCLEKLPRHFPGFEMGTVVNERGWGTAISRDDLEIDPDRGRVNYFSRVEMLVRPISEYFVLELAAKATVRNKEIFNRSHFQRLAEVDITSFVEMSDLWVLEFAERYAASR